MSCGLRDGVRTFYPRAIRSIEVTDLWKGGFQKGSELSLFWSFRLDPDGFYLYLLVIQVGSRRDGNGLQREDNLSL